MNKVSNVRWSTTSSKCKSFGNYKLDLGYVRIITNRILPERNLPMESWDRKNRQTKKPLNWNNTGRAIERGCRCYKAVLHGLAKIFSV